MARRGFQGAVIRGLGARDHEATVIGSELLAPHFLRVRMTSPTLLKEAVLGPTAWLRFWFPDPDGGPTEYQRGYTLSEVDEAGGAFAIDFVLHESAGPASIWAQQAVPGSTVMVTQLGSTRFELPAELPAGFLIVGDSASVPGVNGILQTIPDDIPIELYLEQHHEADPLIPMTAHPRLRAHWVPRQGFESLAAAIEARDWSNWYAWMAPESGTLKQLRSRLKDEFGFPKSEVHAQAYWIQGRSMGKDRNAPAEQPAEAVAAVPSGAALGIGSQDSTASSTAEQFGTAPLPEQAPAPSAPDAATAASTTSPVRGAWRAQAGSRLLAPLKPALIVAGVLQGLVTLLQLAPFVLLLELARLMLAQAPAAPLWTVGIWAVVLMGAGTLLAAALTFWLHLVDARFSRLLRGRLLGKLARLPLGWFTERSSGQVKKLVQDDTFALHYLVTHAVPDAVAAVIAPVAVLGYFFFVDWRLALLLFIPVLVYIVTMYLMMVQSGPKIAQSQHWAERMSTEAGSYLEGQPVIRVFGGAAASSFRARLGEYLSFLNQWQRPFTGKKTLMDLATRPATFLLLICGFGTLFIATGTMAAITLLPFLLLGTTFGARLLGIGYGLSGLRDGLLAARRIQVALDEAALEQRPGSEEADGSAEQSTAPARAAGAGTAPGSAAVSVGTAAPEGLVEFDRVVFGYRPGVPVIDEVSLRLDPGTVTALVGPSGSGKSTLAALLARFHDVGEGAIRIGGRDIREFSAEELYRRVGFVFQQTQLIHGTVRENIALAVPDAADEAIEAVARAARIHERILRLPEGYDTLLGPDAALSGGERQRLTIARALLADSPVLVLDEATAFADPESEYLVQQALNRLTAGRTVLVIAHRLHTIVGVDQIAVLDGGRLVESGRHEQLLRAAGRYRQLWEAGGGAAATGRPETTASEVAR